MIDGEYPALQSAFAGSCRPAARFYHSYGLRIQSDIDLPELDHDADGGSVAPDLVIRRQALNLSAEICSQSMVEIFGPEETDLWWRTIGGFRLPHASNEILVDPNPGVRDDLLAYPLLGTVLALALHRRGQFTFHASAVSVARRGVVILGNKGAGKSTTAASLLAAGHPLVADDIVALDDNPAAPRLVQGFGQVKLDEVALAIVCSPDSRAPVTLRPPMNVPALAAKRRVLFPGGLAPAPVLAGLICVLARGPLPRLVPLPAHEALQAVLMHAYVGRFGTLALRNTALATHFRRAVDLAAIGLVHKLVVPDSVERLPEAVNMIEHYIAGLPSPEV